jgi:hypothetical protein
MPADICSLNTPVFFVFCCHREITYAMALSSSIFTTNVVDGRWRELDDENVAEGEEAWRRR